MNIKYSDALSLNKVMGSFKPKGQLSGSSILKIISLKQEVLKLQENYYKAFEQVMNDNNIVATAQGEYKWEDKEITNKINELLKSEENITAVNFMSDDEFVSMVDGTIELEILAFIEPFFVKKEAETKKAKKS